MERLKKRNRNRKNLQNGDEVDNIDELLAKAREMIDDSALYALRQKEIAE